MRAKRRTLQWFWAVANGVHHGLVLTLVDQHRPAHRLPQHVDRAALHQPAGGHAAAQMAHSPASALAEFEQILTTFAPVPSTETPMPSSALGQITFMSNLACRKSESVFRPLDNTNEACDSQKTLLKVTYVVYKRSRIW